MVKNTVLKLLPIMIQCWFKNLLWPGNSCTAVTSYELYFTSWTRKILDSVHKKTVFHCRVHFDKTIRLKISSMVRPPSKQRFETRNLSNQTHPGRPFPRLNTRIMILVFSVGNGRPVWVIQIISHFLARFLNGTKYIKTDLSLKPIKSMYYYTIKHWYIFKNRVFSDPHAYEENLTKAVVGRRPQRLGSLR